MNTDRYYVNFMKTEIDSLKCKSIELVDENGNCKIRMIAGNQSACIEFIGDKKLPTIQISSSEVNPVEIHFFDAEGRPCFTMGAFGNGDVGITVRDSKGRPRIIVGYDDEADRGLIRCLEPTQSD